MKKHLIISCLVLLAIASASFFGGYYIGKTKNEQNNQSQTDKINSSTTFYSTITSISGNSISLDGLDVNDINYRGKFVITVNDNTSISWRGTEISLSRLKVESRVSVTFSGVILETYPAQIKDVSKVILLEDDV